MTHKILRRGAVSCLFALPPVLAILLAWPVAMIPWWNSPGPTGWQIAVAAPVYLGLLCAPGYIYLAWTDRTATQESSVRRQWLRASLIIAFICSLAGMMAGLLMVLFLPPSLMSAANAAYLLWRFEGRK